MDSIPEAPAEALPPPSPSGSRGGTVFAIALSAMFGLTSMWEGERLHPYRDTLGHGQPMTVCRGDTNVPMHVYSHHECALLLQGKARDIYLPAVQRRLPTIDRDPFAWAAFGDFAYNAGIGAFNHSAMASLYERGHRTEACQALARYRFAGHRQVPGLVLRRIGDRQRIGEVQLCLLTGTV